MDGRWISIIIFRVYRIDPSAGLMLSTHYFEAGATDAAAWTFEVQVAPRTTILFHVISAPTDPRLRNRLIN